jgi:hypothetical protein
MGLDLQVMEVVACTYQTCKSNCHEYGIFFVPSVCAKGTVDPEWKVTPVSGPRFWQRMSLQMVQYKCSNLHYPGDEKMCKNTQMNKKKCGTIDIGLIECDNHIKIVSYLLYLDEKNTQGGKKIRFFAENMTLLKQHLNSMKRVNLATCQMCGKKTYMECQIQEACLF